MLTAAANRAAAAMSGLSHSWTVSRVEPATSPVALVWLVNGAALPARTFSAGGFGDAAAVAVTLTAVMATAVAAALVAATSNLSLDMVSSSTLAKEPIKANITAARLPWGARGGACGPVG